MTYSKASTSLRRALVASAVALTVSATGALAQQGGQQGMDHSKMQGMDHSKMGGMDHSKMMQNTAANPYAQSEMRMHDKMMKAVGADAAETWTRKMIEHHRGGVEMSKIAIAQAKDKETRDKAQKTMAMQNKEIGELQSWLKRHGKKPQ